MVKALWRDAEKGRNFSKAFENILPVHRNLLENIQYKVIKKKL
jgi:hypothetical protein